MNFSDLIKRRLTSLIKRAGFTNRSLAVALGHPQGRLSRKFSDGAGRRPGYAVRFFLGDVDEILALLGADPKVLCAPVLHDPDVAILALAVSRGSLSRLDGARLCRERGWVYRKGTQGPRFLAALERLEEEGLITLTDTEITPTPEGARISIAKPPP